MEATRIHSTSVSLGGCSALLHTIRKNSARIFISRERFGHGRPVLYTGDKCNPVTVRLAGPAWPKKRAKHSPNHLAKRPTIVKLYNLSVATPSLQVRQELTNNFFIYFHTCCVKNVTLGCLLKVANGIGTS